MFRLVVDEHASYLYTGKKAKGKLKTKELSPSVYIDLDEKNTLIGIEILGSIKIEHTEEEKDEN